MWEKRGEVSQNIHFFACLLYYVVSFSISSPVVQESRWAVTLGAVFLSWDFNFGPRPKNLEKLIFGGTQKS